MNDINVRVVEDKPMGRVMRRPRHTFSLKVRPWQIQPFMIAPVLPGETLENFNLAARAVTDPINSPLVGWWLEYYVFYVKHRDLTAQASTLINMHLDPATSMAALKAGAAQVELFTSNGGVKWTEFCLQRVTEEFFRDEEDGAWNAAPNMIGNLPLATVTPPGTNLWFESMRDSTAAAVVQDHELPGEVTPSPYGMDPIFSTHYTQWENMRGLKLTTKSFEDWLAEWGIKTPEVIEDENRPELLRYVREWQLPSNTIDPTSGAPRSAVSWSVAERGDKNRFFKEPGFIFGVQVARPKIYFNKQTGNASAFLDDAYSWLPPVLADQAWTSLKTFTGGGSGIGPLGANSTNGYWIDMRDLFVFGDQYFNYDLAADVRSGGVALPTLTQQRRFATAAMADALFVNSLANTVRSDGVCNLNIKGKIVNQS